MTVVTRHYALWGKGTKTEVNVSDRSSASKWRIIAYMASLMELAATVCDARQQEARGGGFMLGVHNLRGGVHMRI
jgi:hypothetical protein